jgi:hypothetical protein
VTGIVPPSAIDGVVGAEMAQIAAAVRSEYTQNLLAGIDAALVPTKVDRPQSIAHWREVFASGIGPGSSAMRILPRRAAERSRRRNLWIGAAVATLLVVAGGAMPSDRGDLRGRASWQERRPTGNASLSRVSRQPRVVVSTLARRVGQPANDCRMPSHAIPK